MLYGSENWAHFTIHQINALKAKQTTLLDLATTSDIGITHQKFLKFILGVKTNCSNIAVLGELGEYPLYICGIISLLKFWHRTVNLPNNPLVTQALNVLSMGGIESEWLSTVKTILSELNMEEHFDNHNMISTENFSDTCQKKLRAIFVEQWRIKLNNSRKLRFYKLFKTSFIKEMYLETITNFYLRKDLTKFRCSDHRLEIEIGRHNNIDAIERFCKICKTEVENEEHFLRFCPSYNTLRSRYFGHVKTFLQWKEILTCKDKQTTFNLINFIKKGMQIRQKLIDGICSEI